MVYKWLLSLKSYKSELENASILETVHGISSCFVSLLSENVNVYTAAFSRNTQTCIFSQALKNVWVFPVAECRLPMGMSILAYFRCYLNTSAGVYVSVMI